MRRLWNCRRGKLTLLERSASSQTAHNQNLQTTASGHELSADTNREVLHHEKLAKDWWDPKGAMCGLHALNEIRVPFIRDGIVARGKVARERLNTTDVLLEQRILEVGCGGGILTERLARLGANVTAIDLGEELIDAARKHLEHESAELSGRITYKVEPVEVHVEGACDCYDAVVLSEVVEHVGNKVEFLDACVRALRPGGSLFVTAPNKTIPMWLGGILIAENVLGLVPKGTHHWDKLISPLNLQRILDTMNCQTVLVNGSTYDFWRNKWRWTRSKDMCYALQAIKLQDS